MSDLRVQSLRGSMAEVEMDSRWPRLIRKAKSRVENRAASIGLLLSQLMASPGVPPSLAAATYVDFLRRKPGGGQRKPARKERRQGAREQPRKPGARASRSQQGEGREPGRSHEDGSRRCTCTETRAHFERHAAITDFRFKAKIRYIYIRPGSA